MAKRLHFYIKYHVTVNALMIVGDPFSIEKIAKGNSDILHLFGNCICPKCVAIYFIKFIGVLNNLRHVNAKLLVGLYKLRLVKFYLRDDPVAPLQDVADPPVKGRFAINVIVDNVLGSLHRIAFLHDRKCLS